MKLSFASRALGMIVGAVARVGGLAILHFQTGTQSTQHHARGRQRRNKAHRSHGGELEKEK